MSDEIQKPEKPLRKVTIKEEKYVQELVRTGDGTQAVLDVYDTTNRVHAAQMSTDIRNKPPVAKRLKEVLREMYPNLTADTSNWVRKMMDAQIGTGPEEMTWNEKMAAIKLAAELSGNVEPRKSAHLRLNANNKGKLPGVK